VADARFKESDYLPSVDLTSSPIRISGTRLLDDTAEPGLLRLTIENRRMWREEILDTSEIHKWRIFRLA
jgi:hypothetical protein